MQREWYGTASVPPNYSTMFSISGSGDVTQQNYAMNFGNDVVPYGSYFPLSSSRDAFKNFFDKRVPFEAMITPAQVLDGTRFLDMEANPSCSLLSVTSSFTSDGEDSTYTKMSQNFFWAGRRLLLGKFRL